MKIEYGKALRYLFWATVAAFAVSQLFVGLNNDNKSLLAGAIKQLETGNAYAIWVEPNPPLIILLYTIPALAVLKLHVSPALAFQLFGIAMTVWGAWRTEKTLAASSLDEHLKARLLDASLFMLFILPPSVGAFGDREHMLFILSLPWIWQMLWMQQPTWRTIVPAAIGFCIKPYNLLIPAALLLFGGPKPRSFTARLFSPSALMIGGIVVAYTLLVFIFFPQYPLEIMPMLITAYQYITVSLQKRIMFGVFCTTLAMAFIWANRERIPNFLAWIGMTLALCGCFILNGGWLYTLYLLLMQIFLAAFVCVPWNNRAIAHRWRYFLPVSILTPILFYCSFDTLSRDLKSTTKTGYASEYHHQAPELKAQLKEETGTEFVMLSTSMFGVNLAELGEPPRHVYAFDFLWPLPWILDHPDDPRGPEIMNKMVSRLIEALNRQPSPTLVIDKSPHMRSKNDRIETFDFVKIMTKDHPELREALNAYKLEKTLDYCTEKIRKYCKVEIWRKQ